VPVAGVLFRALVADEDLLIRVESLHGLLALPVLLLPLDAARPVLWLAAEQSSAGARRYGFNASFNGGIQLRDLEAMRGERGSQYTINSSQMGRGGSGRRATRPFTRRSTRRALS